ncbi:hypothetical protein RQP46_010661 [Phenoliferia psychrophenolica]
MSNPPRLSAGGTRASTPRGLLVAKTRLQLDGELQSRKPVKFVPSSVGGVEILAGATGAPGKPAGPVYTSALDCLKKTWKFEGIRGVQRGLGAAYTYQVALNGSRLGFFEPIRRQINTAAGYGADETRAWTSLSAGAASGVVGAIFGNPLFLVKARMQAYSAHNPVGAQHNYKSVFHAFGVIIKADGIKGLARGVDAAMLRTAMGSTVQLPAYNLAKVELSELGLKDGIAKYLLSSFFSGLCVCAVMQPADTALTRMYNQAPNSIGPDGKPRGLLYKNPIDCLYKTWQVEGVRGWYKGTTAHLARIAPHTVVTLVANEFITRHWIEMKVASAAKLD